MALAVLAAVPALSGTARADIGAGSTIHVMSDTRMLFTDGGGHVTWEISGPVTADIRRNIDGAFGDGDGNLTPAEASAYATEIDSILENNIFYGCARIIRSALLTKEVQTSTDGLMGPVNDTRPIAIRFYFNADLRASGASAKLGDTTIPMAPFRALRGDANRTFSGGLDWEHQEIMVGFSSFSRVELDRGSITRLRAPGAEIFWFRLSLSAGETSQDRIRFEPFDAAQSPLELFVVLCIFGLLGLWFPRRHLKMSRMKRVLWLHVAVWLMAAGLLLVFFMGIDGVAVWALAPLFAAGSWVLSWGIYIRRWKGIAKPLLPAKMAGPPSDPLSSEAREQEEQKKWEREVQKEMERQGDRKGGFPEGGPAVAAPAGPPPGPAPEPALKTEAPRAFPEPEKVARTLRCPACKSTFQIQDPGTRPLPIKCTACGTEGVLKK
jgi:hypothetical protein